MRFFPARPALVLGAALALAALACLASGGPARAREPAPFPCEPETLRYALRWGIIPVGTATLSRQAEDGACVLRVEARSNLLTDLVAEIRDLLEARVDPATGRSLNYHKRLHEGDARREFEVEYQGATGTLRREAGDGATVFLPAPWHHDPLSVLYHFRHRPFLYPGATAALPVSDGNVLGEARAVFTGRERAFVAGKYLDVLGFDFDQGGTDGLFRMAPGARVRIKVTDDARRIPVLIRARVVVAGFEGNFTGMLLRAVRDGQTVLEF